jgi:hypothetical protein
MKFEYKVIPAPVKGKRGKGVKGSQGRFANALELTMNELAAEGWEYQRADTLPSEERVGLTGRTTTFQNMLVFRRALEPATDAALAPTVTALLTAPAPEPVAAAPATPPAPAPIAAPAPVIAAPTPPVADQKSIAAAAAAAALVANRPTADKPEMAAE